MTDTSISLVSQRPRSMPSGALALAIVLHAAVAAALWWFAPQRPRESQDEPIMVMFDSSPSNVGLQEPEKPGPPAESEAASPQPSNEPPKEAEPQQALAPAPTAAPAPEPQLALAPSPTPSPALELPRPEPPSVTPPGPEPVATLPRFEFSIPPPPSPPPAPSSREFARPAMPRPPAAAVQRTAPAPPRPVPPAPYRPPPAQAPAAMPSPIPGPQPGDVLPGQGRQRNDYLSRVWRQIRANPVSSGDARQNRQEGRVVLRVTLARTGHVLDIGVRTSSGWPGVDAAAVAAVRLAAPFPPVPPEMPGDPVILVLPYNYGLNR